MALVLVVPVTLGSAFSAYAHVLADPGEHTCRCGMEKGECGCPECNADSSDASREGPACSDCGGDDGPSYAGPPVQHLALPAPRTPEFLSPLAGGSYAPPGILAPPTWSPPPPTPPPRIARM